MITASTPIFGNNYVTIRSPLPPESLTIPPHSVSGNTVASWRDWNGPVGPERSWGCPTPASAQWHQNASGYGRFRPPVAWQVPLTWPPHPRSRVNLLPILEPNGHFSGTDSVYLAAWPKHRLGESSRAFHDSYSGIDGEVNFDLVGGLQ